MFARDNRLVVSEVDLSEYLQAGLVILCPALVVVHVPLQRLLGVFSLLRLLVVVTLLLGCLIPATKLK